MQRSLLLLSLLFVMVSSAVGQGSGIGPGEPEWRRYTVKDEEFSVTLPQSPMMRTTQVTRKSDRKVRVEKYLKASFDGITYTVEAFENPEPKQSLDQFVDELRLTGLFDPDTKRQLTVDGFNGIEYSSGKKPFPAIVQILATEKHLYRFTAMGTGAERGTKEFFSSIKLGQQPDGVEVTDYTGEWLYTGREVDVKARLLTKPEPSYTEDARNNGIEGTVVLKVIFSKDGQVTNIRTVAGLPYGLTEQAIKAARKIKFTPAMKEGKPVSMWMQLEYNFSL
jgi:TonB family protein